MLVMDIPLFKAGLVQTVFPFPGSFDDEAIPGLTANYPNSFWALECGKKKVWTMSTLLASDRVVHRPDWLGLLYVFGSSQRLQGLERGSSPTSGTVSYLVRGSFAPDC
jgi:hypothetical protein